MPNINNNSKTVGPEKCNIKMQAIKNNNYEYV